MSKLRTYGLTVFCCAFCCAFCCTLLTTAVQAQDSDAVAAEEAARKAYIRSHYSKFEHRIPMRDGVELFTAVYIPNQPTGTWPLLMVRTPYSSSPYGADQYRDTLGPSELFEKAGYIFVFQDVRGRYLSQGEFVNMRPHLAKKRGPQYRDKNIIDASTKTSTSTISRARSPSGTTSSPTPITTVTGNPRAFFPT